ncbi:MAG: hypothetical protein ACON4V_05025 [Parvibaculales bacterium]
MQKFFVTVIFSLLVFACANGSQNATSERSNFTLSAPSYDALFDATTATLNGLGLTITSSSKARGEIKAKSGVSAFSWGEYISISLSTKPNGQGAYSLRVESDAAVPFNVSAKDWRQPIASGIRKRLNSR